MLLANSSVSGKAATGHVLKVRSHRRLSPNTRSSSKIITPNRGSWGFSERTLEVLTNLSCWRFVFYSITDNGIDSLLSPLRGTPTAYLNAPLACFLAYVKYASTLCFACAPFLAPKSLRQIGNPWFLKRTPEAYTNLSCGRFVFCWERGGDRSIGEANLRKGRQPLQWKCASHLSMAGAPRVRPAPVRVALVPHPKVLRQIGKLGFGERTPEVLTNLSCWRFVFCWERGGDRSIGEANLRKGRSPFYGWPTLRPPCAHLAPTLRPFL